MTVNRLKQGINYLPIDWVAEIKEFRDSMGWSQYDLAMQLGVAISTVVRWETGRTVIRARTWEQVKKMVRDHWRPETWPDWAKEKQSA